MQSVRELRLFVVKVDDDAHQRAAEIITALRERRRVVGRGPEWTVTYLDVDTSGALELCERDLTAIDGSWPEVLDLAPVPPRPVDHPEPD